MLHSNSPPLQSLLQRNSSPLKQQSLNMNGTNSDSYFIFDELSTALPERNNSNGGSKILGNSNNFSNKSSSVGSSIGGSTNTSTATNLSSSTFQRPQFNQQQQQRFGFGELKNKWKKNSQFLIQFFIIIMDIYFCLFVFWISIKLSHKIFTSKK